MQRILQRDVSMLIETERFEIANHFNMQEKVTNYVMEVLNGANVQIIEGPITPFFELATSKLLDGWKWQATHTAILFFDDESEIHHGYLTSNFYVGKFAHSWICFKFEEESFVYDPAFNLIMNKELYFHLFNVKTIAKFSALNRKKMFIYRVKNYITDKIPKEYYDQSEIYVEGGEDITSPLYKSKTGYKDIIIKDDNILSLTAHYYGNFML